MRTIWRFPITVQDDANKVATPRGALLLHVGRSATSPSGQICMWFEVESEAPIEPKYYKVYGTGHEVAGLRDYDNKYIATVFDPPFVWHVYQEAGPPNVLSPTREDREAITGEEDVRT